MQKLVASTVLFFVLSGIVFSQGKEIKKDEFSQIYYSALDKSREVDRRMDSKLEYYRDGTTTTTEEWLYEYLAPYTRRLVYQKIIDGKTTRIEEVNIDDNNYCRFDDRFWERRSTNCLTGFTALMSQASHQVGGIVSSQFTVEDGNLNGAKAKLYREYTKYRNQAPQNNDGDRLRFLENRFWLGDKNEILKQETRSGLLGEKEISSLWVDIYYYNPKDLKIEAPIK